MANLLKNPLVIALGGALVVVLAHGFGHQTFGDPTSFAAAAVTEVRAVVFVATFLVIWLFLRNM